ncbi:alpha/beta hydrolase family protein [Croceibacterium ferulae]|uniref:alpha/beta hydrolase family protein n=1 Tax=Croceibacterium ferulae TaxID=1854641 RepID=UPI000EB01723|nr:alpha/beta fold hydrolase [Croceibacterium ferulae]
MTVEEGSVIVPVAGQHLRGTLLAPEKLIPGFLFVHGWGGNQEEDLDCAEEIARLGCLCFTFDLRGHAGSDARQEEVTRQDGLRDVIAAYDFLAAHPLVDRSAIGVVGVSYGGYLATLLTAERSVQWLGLRVPALYPDREWETPKALLDKKKVRTYRNRFHGPRRDRALTACADFEGHVLIVESEFDAHVPHTAIASYMGAFHHAGSLSHRVIRGADHAMRAPEDRKTYKTLLIHWVDEMVRAARRSSPQRRSADSAG